MMTNKEAEIGSVHRLVTTKNSTARREKVEETKYSKIANYKLRDEKNKSRQQKGILKNSVTYKCRRNVLSRRRKYVGAK